jgi:ribonuclease HII
MASSSLCDMLDRCQPIGLEAGCDEAGRGCLAGPVAAAAVILPPDFHHPLLRDSKQLDAAARAEARLVVEAEALAWAVAFVSAEQIDRVNILQASILAMHLALDQLTLVPDFVAVDGNRFRPWRQVPFATQVKGDGRFRHIAAASILAKTHRDAHMAALDDQFPGYGWQHNKGYPTGEHRRAIELLGPTPEHRRSFRWQPLPVQGELFGG